MCLFYMHHDNTTFEYVFQESSIASATQTQMHVSAVVNLGLTILVF